ncbi:MAG: hypothetical protein MI757_22980 [Pirellulales bacterium]|nr:hypothetical protein [Pirellulales bacterium]
MATIIRSSRTSGSERSTAFNFDDMAEQAGQYLDDVRAQASSIVSQAQAEAKSIRQSARLEGKREAEQQAHQVVESRMAQTLLPSLKKLAEDIAQARETWTARWERGLVQLATAIAEKVVRREISNQPEISLEIVRESLNMTAGIPQLTIRLSPSDYETLGPEVEKLADQIRTVGTARVVADESISPGGCRVDSEFGVIDQQIESQLARIAEELT